MLQCPRTKTYPLSLEIETCDDTEVPYSEQFIRRMIPRLDWSVFRDAAAQLPDPDMMGLLPEQAPNSDASVSENVLKAIHRAMLEWHVLDGTLSNTAGDTYAVKNGIPNLVITEVRKEDDASNDAQEDEEEEDEKQNEMDVE